MRPILVILAAGVGSRFGGLKQLEAVGPGGASLIDYAVYDAMRSGFGRVVLVVRREFEAMFREFLDRGVGRRVEVDLVFQELDDLPPGFTAPQGRAKPWGTGQAVLATAPVVDGPFVVANADDFYGAQAIAAVGNFLTESPPIGALPVWAMVGFELGRTLPADGVVSRGLCRADGDWLLGIDEAVEIWREGDRACWRDVSGGLREADLDTPVSMNLWAFTTELFVELGRGFREFLEADPGDRAEYYLPMAVGDAIRGGRARVRVLAGSGQWCGMTSPGDRRAVVETLRGLVGEGHYPERLWD